MPEIKACIFDMGKVLVHFSHDQMLQQMATLCNCEAAYLRTVLFDSGLLLEYERGAHTEEQIHELIQSRLGCTVDREHLEDAAARIFSENEDILPLVRELKAAGFPLVLLSNTSRIHFEFIRREFSILQEFDHYVLSYEAKLLKPDPGIYELAVAATGHSAEHCFFTDDIHENVVAARATGLQAEVFTDAASLRRHLRSLGLPLSS